MPKLFREKNKNLTCVSVYLDNAQIELLKIAAKDEDRSMSNAAKQAVLQFLKKYAPQSTQ